PAGPDLLQRGVAAGALGRGQAGDRAPDAGPRARRGAALLGPRPRRDPLPPRRLPLPALGRRDRVRALRRGARARRGVAAPVRPAPFEHLHLALALLPP